MTTYDFICNHLENDYPDAIPVMDEYLMAWLGDGEGITEGLADVEPEDQFMQGFNSY